ncbi:hypothetical protein V1273_005563 [Bradyrhizobium sp. AZCC 1721]
MNQQPAPASEEQPLVILTTPRLILRAAAERDISVLRDLILGDSDVMRFAFAGAPLAREAAEDFIRRFFTFGGSPTGMAVLAEKPAGEIIGFAGLSPCDALGTNDFEIGFVLARRVWGRGSRPKLGRRSSLSGSTNSNAKDCSDWSTREMCRQFTRLRSSECVTGRRLRSPSAAAGAFM